MADQGELQAGSNLGKGQVKAADYFLEPNIVSANKNSGGGGIGAAAGALGGLFGGGGSFVGGIVGGINVKKGEANVTLSVVNARTTEEYVVEGYARKKDISWGAGGGGGWWGGFAAAGATATRIPRSARSSSSPISTPTPSWSASSAGFRTALRPQRSKSLKRHGPGSALAVPFVDLAPLLVEQICIRNACG